MSRVAKSISLLLVAFGTITTVAAGSNNLFVVTITPRGDAYSVKNSVQGVAVQCDVKNVSGKPQVIGLWECASSKNWRAKDSSITIMTRPCFASAVIEKTLQPDEVFTTWVSLTFPKSKIGKNVKVKLGFIPFKIEKPDPKTKKEPPPRPAGTYWSNEASITVEP